MASLLTELKRRNVFRVAVGYFVLAWVVLQIADLVAPALHLPDWTLSFVTFIGIIGFPFALFFAWVFELTPEGLKRSEDVSPEESITGSTAGGLNKVIIVLLGLAVVILLADRFLGLSGGGADQPVAVQAPPTPTEVAETVSVEDPGPRSIAVLPFVNMSDDKQQEYFSDGISEELLNALAQIRELRVAARTSSFAFKGQNTDITEIGRQLNVETVLEGSVRKSGAKVRITAQLIDVSDGYHLWSNTYDRDLTDIFAVQDEISGAIVEALKVHLATGESLALKPVVNVDAYNLMLQARHNLRSRTTEGLETALKQYRQALDIEPGYAQAWAGMGIATLLLNEEQYGKLPVEVSMNMARGYLDKGLAIAPQLWEVQAAEALYHLDSGNWQRGIDAVGRALAANPSEGILYLWQAHLLSGAGEFRNARQAIEKAYSVDPLHPSIQSMWVQQMGFQGRFEELERVLTPGTVVYYMGEWTLALTDGRWADMFKAVEAAEDHGVGRLEMLWGPKMFNAFWLAAPELIDETASRVVKDMLRSRENPQLFIDKLLTPQASSLNQQDLALLVSSLAHAGRCADVVSLLEKQGYEQMENIPIPDFSASEGGFALSLAWCLYNQGELERARSVAGKLRASLEDAVAQDRPGWMLAGDLVTTRFLMGEESEAVAELRTAVANNYISYSFYSWSLEITPWLQLPEVQAIKRDHQARLNAERAKLGWDPVDF